MHTIATAASYTAHVLVLYMCTRLLYSYLLYCTSSPSFSLRLSFQPSIHQSTVTLHRVREAAEWWQHPRYSQAYRCRSPLVVRRTARCAPRRDRRRPGWARCAHLPSTSSSSASRLRTTSPSFIGRCPSAQRAMDTALRNRSSTPIVEASRSSMCRSTGPSGCGGRGQSQGRRTPRRKPPGRRRRESPGRARTWRTRARPTAPVQPRGRPGPARVRATRSG